MNSRCIRRPLSIAMTATATVVAMPCLATTTFPSGDFVIGKTTLHFDNGGKFSVNEVKGGLVVEGAYVATTDQITFTDKSGKEACAGKGQESGTYHWSYDKGALIFGKIADRCDARAHDLTEGPWEQSK